ncbi:hypothetical protein [Nocardia aurea]|uniref:Lipoprotein n=1 Tax=Nocardia aurea TaxID=2144174 RepID=A0ABV3FM13_9NOCA
MGGTRRAVLGTVLALCVLAGCDARVEPPEVGPAGVDFDTEVVEFDPSGFNGPPFAALIDSESSAEAFAGWFASRRGSASTLPRVVQQPELLGDTDTYAYLAMVTSTGCRAPTSAEWGRVGTDLRPEFLGGVDHPECVRAYTPFVVFKVPRAAIDGVTTVGGVAADSDGPAETVGSVELSPTAPAFTPREVTDPARRTELADELSATGSDRTRVLATLDHTSGLLDKYGPTTLRRYAFPVRSCPDDLLVLHVGRTELRARALARVDAALTCEAPTTHLAVFDVRSLHIPDGARPVS